MEAVTSARSRAPLFLMLAASLALSACDGGGVTDPGATFTARLESGGSIRPGTVATVIVTGASTANGPISARIGSVSIPFAALDDSTLVALVPELPAGTAVLRIDIASAAARVSVDVQAGLAIVNPSAQAATDLDAILAGVPAAPAPGYTAAQWSVHRATMDSIVRNLKVTIAAASPDAQLAIARVISTYLSTADTDASAPPIMSEHGLTSACVSASASVSGHGLVFATGLTLAIAAAPLALTGVGTGPALAVAGLGVLVMYKSYPAVINAVVKWKDVCSHQDAVTILDGSDLFSRSSSASLSVNATHVPDTIAFVAGRSKTFTVFETIRPFSGTDAQLGANARPTKMIDSWHDEVAELPAVLRALVPSSLLPARVSQLPQAPSVTRELDASRVRIENVSLSKVTLAAQTAGSVMTLTARTTDSSDANFSFDVVSTENTLARKRLAARVRKVQPLHGWYEGTYTLVGVYTTNPAPHACSPQAGQQGKVYLYVHDSGLGIDGPQIAVVYTKSIITGMPSLYYKTTLSRTGALSNSWRLSHGWGEAYSGQFWQYFSLGLTLVDAGVGFGVSATYPDETGTAERKVAVGSGCQGPLSDYSLSYPRIRTSAAKSGFSAPSDVSMEIVNSLLTQLDGSVVKVP